MQEKCWEHTALSESMVGKPEQDHSFQEQLDAQQFSWAEELNLSYATLM